MKAPDINKDRQTQPRRGHEQGLKLYKKLVSSWLHIVIMIMIMITHFQSSHAQPTSLSRPSCFSLICSGHDSWLLSLANQLPIMHTLGASNDDRDIILSILNATPIDFWPGSGHRQSICHSFILLCFSVFSLSFFFRKMLPFLMPASVNWNKAETAQTRREGPESIGKGQVCQVRVCSCVCVAERKLDGNGKRAEIWINNMYTT